MREVEVVVVVEVRQGRRGFAVSLHFSQSLGSTDLLCLAWRENGTGKVYKYSNKEKKMVMVMVIVNVS